MLRNCTAARYALNKSRMLRLADYSRAALAELRAETGIALRRAHAGHAAALPHPASARRLGEGREGARAPTACPTKCWTLTAASAPSRRSPACARRSSAACARPRTRRATATSSPMALADKARAHGRQVRLRPHDRRASRSRADAAKGVADRRGASSAGRDGRRARQLLAPARDGPRTFACRSIR